MADFNIDRSTTALLIADFYAEAMGTLPHAVERGVVQKTVELQAAAREAGMMVCYCATVFRPGYPEISERNKTFSARKTSGQPAVFDPVAVIHPDVRPRDGEVVVGKHRVNALFGTGLDVALTGNNINTIILLGYATSGVVLSTTRYASDRDYRLFIVADCCADSEPDVHDFLIGRILNRQADIVTASEAVSAIRSG
ncbi:Maleamate amidohydrolase [Geodia barretti]|uniref:Maleamate amidohydrolase n=1 Tax=Geodia barretti TaxID=519541 RepID=A0AA35T2X1_GEOBA|nr:Maleamate amidohydrolase [Geodia barretti]